MRTNSVVAMLAASCLAGACGSESGTEPVPTTDLQCTIPTDEIFDGGVGRDGIPALNFSPIVRGGEAGYLSSQDRVLGVVVNGQPRAYPFGILWWHEVVNDTVGGEPILVSYCPLTGSGIAFDRSVDGDVRLFGVSGLLFRSNLIMFDRETSSLWNQMLLGSQCGVDRGKALTRIPIVETTWEEWRRLHPSTTVLSLDTGFQFTPYFEYPYGDYDEVDNDRVDFLPQGTTFSRARPPKELVLGVFDDGGAKAYPFGIMSNGDGLVNDRIGDTPIAVTFLIESQTAMVYERRIDGEELTFSVVDTNPLTFTDAETGSTWDAEGVAVDGPHTGARLPAYADAYVAFWFAWSLYFPSIEIVE